MVSSAEDYLKSIELQRNTVWADNIAHARTEMRRTPLTDSDIHDLSSNLLNIMEIPDTPYSDDTDIIVHIDGTRISKLIGALNGIALDMMEIDPDHPLQQIASPGVDIHEALRLQPEERAECQSTLREMWSIIEEAKNGSVYEQIAAVAVEIAVGMHYQQKQVDSRGWER